MMNKPLTAAAALAVALPAAAQESGLTSEDARGFLEAIQPTAEQAVEQGDWQGVQNWLSRHVADDAPVYMEGKVLSSNGPALSYSASMTGLDLQKFASMGMSGPQANMLDMIEGYTIRTRIMDTWQLPGGKVSAAIAFYEYGAFRAGDQVPFSGPFSSEAVCALRMGGSADDVTIELANCEIKSNI